MFNPLPHPPNPPTHSQGFCIDGQCLTRTSQCQRIYADSGTTHGQLHALHSSLLHSTHDGLTLLTLLCHLFSHSYLLPSLTSPLPPIPFPPLPFFPLPSPPLPSLLPCLLLSLQLPDLLQTFAMITTQWGTAMESAASSNPVEPLAIKSPVRKSTFHWSLIWCGCIICTSRTYRTAHTTIASCTQVMEAYVAETSCSQLLLI